MENRVLKLTEFELFKYYLYKNKLFDYVGMLSLVLVLLVGWWNYFPLFPDQTDSLYFNIFLYCCAIFFFWFIILAILANKSLVKYGIEVIAEKKTRSTFSKEMILIELPLVFLVLYELYIVLTGKSSFSDLKFSLMVYKTIILVYITSVSVVIFVKISPWRLQKQFLKADYNE